MKFPTQIVLATGNAHKILELRAILGPLLPDVAIIALPDLGLPSSPPDEIESYQTFEENAAAKAEWALELSGIPSLADDSGLCVDALGGAPGVRSNRWAGPTDHDRINRLLAELDRVNATLPDERSAKFVCAGALAIPGQQTIVATGELAGIIALSPLGDGGFGYDPIFLLPGYSQTVSQLGQATKNQISHRASAIRSIVAIILG